jgi:hypothetical protein
MFDFIDASRDVTEKLSRRIHRFWGRSKIPFFGNRFLPTVIDG